MCERFNSFKWSVEAGDVAGIRAMAAGRLDVISGGALANEILFIHWTVGRTHVASGCSSGDCNDDRANGDRCQPTGGWNTRSQQRHLGFGSEPRDATNEDS
jgi:hypothetical protein